MKSTGRMKIDGRVALIDGEIHRIDFAVELFQEIIKELEKQ